MIYLTKRHISISIISAFIKKLARIALFSPPAYTEFLIALVYNLINRHQKCQILINRHNPTGLLRKPKLSYLI